MQKRTSLPVWFVRLACVMYATLALLVIAPPVAVLAAVKDPTITLSATSGTGYAKGVPTTFTATTDGAS